MDVRFFTLIPPRSAFRFTRQKKKQNMLQTYALRITLNIHMEHQVNIRVSVSLSPEAHAIGKEQARRHRRSFSNYLCWLIEKDAKAEPKPVPPKQAAA